MPNTLQEKIYKLDAGARILVDVIPTYILGDSLVV